MAGSRTARVKFVAQLRTLKVNSHGLRIDVDRE